MTHQLKILPEYFEAVQKGIKNFEIRINDRGFKVGDKLLLQEWHDGKYTGREITRNVDYILSGCAGLTDGFVIISWGGMT